jgi:hypothetical protein
VRAIPTSRAYWELRAEQVLNRVFNPEAPIDVEICETAEQPPTGSPAPGQAGSPRVSTPGSRRTGRRTVATASATATASARPVQPGMLLAGLSLLITGTAAIGLVALSLWQQGHQALRQERNLLLVERLRALGPATAAQQADTVAGGAVPQPQQLPGAPGAGGADPEAGLPPPPSEPWMEELATLPASSAPPANVLRVPMNRRVTSPAPAAPSRPPSRPSSRPPAGGAAASGGGELPQLVGVVQVPGRPGSAIFQVNGSSTNAIAGESIGGSGWRLQSTNGDSAVIERDGVQRRLSISSGL